MGLSSASKRLLKASGGMAVGALKLLAKAPGAYLDRVEAGLKAREAARVSDNRKIIQSRGFSDPKF